MGKNKTKKEYNVISLFSGCGGLDLGIEGNFKYLDKLYPKNPFKIIWANDINEKAVKTYKLNFPNTKVIWGDITQILNNDKSYKLPNAEIVMGGFPCQDFSLSGKRKGLTVQRGKLYQSMVKVVEIVKPRIFIAENVKGLISWEKGLAIKTIIEDFAKLGYKVDYKIFNAADYGVPQNRERVIILGMRNDVYVDFNWPEPTHTKDFWITIKEAIDDLTTQEKHESMPNCGYSKAKLFPGKQGNIKTNPNKVAPAMRAEHHGNIEFHYSIPRRLSAREAARIQSFPDDFVFVSSTTDAYRQIGNAVAPVFAWHIAGMLKDILIKIEEQEA